MSDIGDGATSHHLHTIAIDNHLDLNYTGYIALALMFMFMTHEGGAENLKRLDMILEESTDDLNISIRNMRAHRHLEDSSDADPFLEELRDAVMPYLKTDKVGTLAKMNTWIKKVEPKAMFASADDGELTLDLLGN